MKTDIHFGKINSEDEDWREGLVDEDPDDVELDVTPQDVIDILGFDPKEFSTKPTVNAGEKSPNPKGCNQHTGPNCAISRKDKFSVPLIIPKSLKSKYEDLSEWHTHLASVYYKLLPVSWDQKYKAEVISSIAGQIRRGIETIKNNGSKLSDKNQDVVIRFTSIDPSKLSNRGDTRYGSGDLAKVIAEGKDLTPVVVGKDSSGQRLLDGHHRMRAYQIAKKNMPSIVAEVTKGTGKIRFSIDSPPTTNNLGKKGWSDEARKAAAAKRKRKQKVKSGGGLVKLKSVEAEIKSISKVLDSIPAPKVGMARSIANFTKRQFKDPTPKQIQQGIKLSQRLAQLHQEAAKLKFKWTLAVPDKDRSKISKIQLEMRDNESQVSSYRTLASEFKKLDKYLKEFPEMTRNRFSPEARMKAILARRAQARIDRKTSSQKKSSAKAQAKALVDRLKKNLSDSKKLKAQKERDKEAVAKKEVKQKELKEQKVASLDKSRATNNMLKLGWTEEARRAALLKRKRKTEVAESRTPFVKDNFTQGELMNGKIVGDRLKNLMHPDNPNRASLLKGIASLWTDDASNSKLRKMMSELTSMAVKGGRLEAYHPGAGEYFRGGESRGIKASAASYTRDKKYAKLFGKVTSLKIDPHTPALDLDKMYGGSALNEIMIDLRKSQKKKGPVMNNVVKALLIINAKKGWSEAARKKAALKRRMEFRAKQLAKAAKRPAAKSFGPSGIDSSGKRIYTTGDIESEVKAQRKRRKDEMRAFSKPVDSAAYQKVLDGMDKKGKPSWKTRLAKEIAKRKGLSNNAKKGWSDAARKKAAMTRKQRRSMNLSGHVAAGNYSYREATNKIEKARKTMENRIKIGAIAPEERRLFNKKVDGFHSNLTRKMDRMVKEGDVSPSEFIGLKKEMKAFISDRAFVESSRKAKERQKKRPNSGKSPFGPG